MKKLLFMLFTLFILTMVLAESTNSDDILGKWEFEDKGSRIEMFKSGNVYNGKIIWAPKVMEADGKTSKMDVNNPDANLRTRSIIGTSIITGLKYKDGEYIDGKIYDPKSGDTYSCKAVVKKDVIELRAYMGSPFLGKTVTWNRIK